VTNPEQHAAGGNKNDGNKDGAHKRILALDVGTRRIGVAVSDGLGITAQGLTTIQRKNKKTDYAALRAVVEEYAVSEIVVGFPLRMSGEGGPMAEKMTVFAEELRAKFNLPIHLWDERLTSAEANRILRSTDMSIEKRAGAVDRMAAVLILQSFLAARQSQ
jgi:putative Holliday junction resolvase